MERNGTRAGACRRWLALHCGTGPFARAAVQSTTRGTGAKRELPGSSGAQEGV